MITKKVKRFKVRPDHWTPDMDCLMGKEISVFKIFDGEYITPRLKPHKLVDDRMWCLAKEDFVVKKKKLKKSISL